MPRLSERLVTRPQRLSQRLRLPPQPLGKERKRTSALEFLINIPLKGMEQTFTTIGSFLTFPLRVFQSEEQASYDELQGIANFFPGGEQYKAYEKWKGSPLEPETLLPLPSWKQLGSTLQPYLKNDILLKAIGVDVSEWEETERFEWGRLGLGDMVELAPLLFIGGAPKKLGEESLHLALKQIAKGKPAEEAVNITFSQMAKKGKLPKFRIAPEAPPIRPVLRLR